MYKGSHALANISALKYIQMNLWKCKQMGQISSCVGSSSVRGALCSGKTNFLANNKVIKENTASREKLLSTDKR